MKYYVVEKKNKNAVHFITNSKEIAQRWIDVDAVESCSKGHFTDKTLKPNSFKIKSVK